MPWARLDDSFWRNDKIRGVGNGALAVYMLSISYAAGQLTDGLVDAEAVHILCYKRDVDAAAACADLVRANLWHDQGDGSYLIHDFLDYNPSRADVLEERAKAKERVKDWRERQREFAERNAVRNGVTNGVRNTRPGPGPGPVPVPDPGSRPEDPHAVADAPVGGPQADKVARSQAELQTGAKPAARSERKAHPHQEQVDALCEVLGIRDLDGLTDFEKGRFFTAAKQLHGAKRSRAEIVQAAANWYPGKTLTATGLAANITDLLRGPPRSSTNGAARPNREIAEGEKHGLAALEARFRR